MKHFKNIFYFFLFEGIFMLLFTTALSFLDDVNTRMFFKIAIVSVIITIVLGAVGYLFDLFKKEDRYEEQ